MGALFQVGVAVICFVFLAGGVLSDHHNRRHINSVAHVKSSSSPGCVRKSQKSNVFLLGPANACNARKPLKLSSVLKMGKQLCSPDWKICEKGDKPLEQLSWKAHKMPQGCYAFNYGKKKAAGYGQSCRANLYFDGILCCPVANTKADHYFNTKAPKVKKGVGHTKNPNSHHNDIRLNLVKKK